MFEWIARLTAVLALATGVAAWVMGRESNRVRVIPMELAQDEVELLHEIATRGADIRKAIHFDTYFIMTYALMFLGFALLHWLQGANGALFLAITTASLAILTAVLDVGENRAVLEVMNDLSHGRFLYGVSSVKWLAFFLVLAFCAPLFMNTPRFSVTLLGVAFLLVGILGVIASAALVFTSAHRNLIGLLLYASFTPITLATVLFLWKPRLLLG